MPCSIGPEDGAGHAACDLVGTLRARSRNRALLTGVPGIGKTTLLEGAVDGLERAAVLRASGRESEIDLPFAVLANLLRPAEREFGALPGPQTHALRRALGLEEGDAAVDRLSVGVATLGVMAVLASRRPLLVIVDDPSGWTSRPARRCSSPRGDWLRCRSRSCSPAREGELPEAELGDLPTLPLRGLRTGAMPAPCSPTQAESRSMPPSGGVCSSLRKGTRLRSSSCRLHVSTHSSRRMTRLASRFPSTAGSSGRSTPASRDCRNARDRRCSSPRPPARMLGMRSPQRFGDEGSRWTTSCQRRSTDSSRSRLGA